MSDPLVPPALAEPAGPIDRRHWLLAGVIAILGGYLTIIAIGGNLIQQLLGFGGGPAELTVLFVSQLVFAVAVTVLGYFLAPGSLGMRLLASALYAAAVVLLVASLTLRVGGGLGRALSPLFFGATIANPFFMILLFGGLGWLLASGARGIAYLSLVLAPVGVLLALANLNGAVSSIVQLLAVGVAAVVILLVSFPRRPIEPEHLEAAEPIDTADLPS